MTDRGFESDAAYFDIVARDARDPADRRYLREVAKKYRSLSKNGGASVTRSRREHWRHRAEECRTLAEQFTNATCRTQLQRLADTYDMMVANSDIIAEA
jgi:hypothetical protein